MKMKICHKWVNLYWIHIWKRHILQINIILILMFCNIGRTIKLGFQIFHCWLAIFEVSKLQLWLLNQHLVLVHGGLTNIKLGFLLITWKPWYVFDQNTCLLPLSNWYYLFLYGSGLTGKRTGLPSKIIKMEWTEYRTQETCSFSKVLLSK